MDKNEITTDIEHLEAVKEIRAYLEAHFGDDEYVEKLAEFINDESWQVREAVAESLIFIPTNEVVRFSVLLNDQNYYVSNAAKRSLKQMNLYSSAAKKQEPQSSSLFPHEQEILKKYGKEALALLYNDYRSAYQVTLGSVAHDLRGLIATVVASVQSIQSANEQKMTETDLQPLRKQFDRALGNLNMMTQMTEDIGTLIRKAPQERTQESVSDLVKKAIEMELTEFRNTKRDIHDIKVESDVPRTLMFSVSRELIIRVFCNLIKNALEAFLVGSDTFADTGLVKITGRHVGDGVEIAFTDNGHGIPEDDLEVVRQFRPSGTSKKRTGTGFGLSIAYEKILEHKGTLNITSKVGKGTTLTVFIPDKEECQ